MTIWQDLWWAARSRMKWRYALARIWCEFTRHRDIGTGYGFDQCRRCGSNAPIGNDPRGWLP